jgi:putative transcriptional regulator
MTTAKKDQASKALDPASSTDPLISYSADHLANQFLIAMPGMVDSNFAG